MTAPSKTFSAPTDAQIDVDSPLDATLMTQIRDALIHLEEWLGKDYVAAINHNHDGVNSAAIDIGTEGLRNGSFENASLDGWDQTAYVGGTIAVGTAGAMDGKYAAAITSTVAANGGGDLVSSGPVAVTGGQKKQFRLQFSASAINVASSAIVQWLDASLAQISESDIYSTTNTPTSARLCVRRISAPANARFCKVKLIGGKNSLGGVGTGTGTIYFDGVVIENPAMLGGEQVFTASGTFSAVWGDVEVEAQGAGATGGGGGGYARGPVNDTSGDVTVTVGAISTGNAGSSSFSTVIGGGGRGPAVGVAGGTASGGSVNVNGLYQGAAMLGFVSDTDSTGYGVGGYLGGTAKPGIVIVRW